MRILSIIVGLLLVVPSLGDQTMSPHVNVGGHIANPGHYMLTKNPMTIADLIVRIVGIPVTPEEAQSYFEGETIKTFTIVFYRDKKVKVRLRFGRDDDYMRKTVIKNGDTFDIRRQVALKDIKKAPTIIVKPKK